MDVYVFHGIGVGAGVGAGVAVCEGVEVGAMVGVALGTADGAADGAAAGAALVTGTVDASVFAMDDGAGVALLPQALTSPAMSKAMIARCRNMTLPSFIDAEGDAPLNDAAVMGSLLNVGGAGSGQRSGGSRAADLSRWFAVRDVTG